MLTKGILNEAQNFPCLFAIKPEGFWLYQIEMQKRLYKIKFY